MVMWMLGVLCCLLVGSRGFASNGNKVPVWSPVYTVKGTITIPYSEIVEPFEAWFDSKIGKSRIDYYDGMEKTYQLDPSAQLPYGSLSKVVPVTTETSLNKLRCLQQDGTMEHPVFVQAALPDMTGYRYIGTDDTINGIKATKWTLEEPINNKVNKHSVWTKLYKNSAGDSITIPVRYEMEGYSTLLGMRYDHYFLDYTSYDDKDIDPDVFKIDVDQALDVIHECTAIPRHEYFATFNPMTAYVHTRHDTHLHEEFNRFKDRHNKNFKTDEEHEKRLNIFRHHLRLIHSHNRANMGYTLAVNNLADRTDEELAALRGRRYTIYNEGLPFPYSNAVIKEMSTTLPEQFDWRHFGAVNRVKDQTICGSCWSFGAVGAVEGALFLRNGGHLVSLSEQAIIDCSWGFGNSGCDGGEDFRAFEWIMKHGLPTDKDYGGYLGVADRGSILVVQTAAPPPPPQLEEASPGSCLDHGMDDVSAGAILRALSAGNHKGAASVFGISNMLKCDGYCHIDNVTIATKIKGWVNVTLYNEDALKLAIVKHGPISVAMDASMKTLLFYSSGVYYDSKCANAPSVLDHAVLAVGYGVKEGEKYWIIKNSWSDKWGDNGYVLMAMKDNNCGITSAPTYVLI